ncbi:unnamed protein product [Spirodela intermedia]|uniref:Tetrapyrrole biosynthesis uroporphyrinogen III synthase domain-containing protein n=1 Tax=Spirodela intermedia TaxID=51605 RepID=A0A7I8LHF6_SPIIN|nr:unnamed protein product [Spirodela intermedia]
MSAVVAAAAPPPPLKGRRIAFTAPPVHGARLAELLQVRGAEPLPIPTVFVESTPSTIAALRRYLPGGGRGAAEALESFSALAFTSRVGISAFAAALSGASEPPLADSGESFTVGALGKDAELLHHDGFLSKLCRNPHRIRVLVPEIASPDGLVAALGEGSGKKILCPVPAVVGLAEPPVVPEFLRALAAMGWAPARVPAYETRWAGAACAASLLAAPPVDAVVFTSTAEVEGLLKALAAAGWRWRAVAERRPQMLVAAHGPVTARGAAALGVPVDVVGSKFSTFDGVLEALAARWGSPSDPLR